MRFTAQHGLKGVLNDGLASKLQQAAGGGGMMHVDVADLI